MTRVFALLAMALPLLAQDPVGTGSTGSGGGGGASIPCAISNALLYYAGVANTADCSADMTWLPSSSGLTITRGTVTASRPATTSTATWNNGAVTFVHQFVNVTDTASAAGSLLADWQVGGASKFSVSKAGAISAVNSGTSTWTPAFGNWTAGGEIRASSYNSAGRVYSFGTNGAPDTTLTGSTAGVIALTGTTPTFQFGGTTSSFGAVAREGAGISFKLADGTAYSFGKMTTLQLVTTTEATCNSTTRFTLDATAGGTGVADTVRMCVKDSADNYAWVAIF